MNAAQSTAYHEVNHGHVLFEDLLAASPNWYAVQLLPINVEAKRARGARRASDAGFRTGRAYVKRGVFAAQLHYVGQKENWHMRLKRLELRWAPSVLRR